MSAGHPNGALGLHLLFLFLLKEVPTCFKKNYASGEWTAACFSLPVPVDKLSPFHSLLSQTPSPTRGELGMSLLLLAPLDFVLILGNT